MTKKIKKEKYYNVSELMEILKLDEEIILHSIKSGLLKEEHWISEETLTVYLEGKKIDSERLARLEKRAEEGKKIFEERNTLLNINKDEKYQGKIWNLYGK